MAPAALPFSQPITKSSASIHIPQHTHLCCCLCWPTKNMGPRPFHIKDRREGPNSQPNTTTSRGPIPPAISVDCRPLPPPSPNSSSPPSSLGPNQSAFPFPAFISIHSFHIDFSPLHISTPLSFLCLLFGLPFLDGSPIIPSSSLLATLPPLLYSSSNHSSHCPSLLWQLPANPIPHPPIICQLYFTPII